MIKTEADIKKLVENDPWMMEVLRAAETLRLSDWWIGAGFLRNKVWDAIAGNESQKSRDVDLVYFDDKNIEPESDWKFDEEMTQKFPFAEWEIRNQARMHYKNDFPPYTSTADGISHWVETATCVAVKLAGGELKFLYCHGSDDLLNMVARPVREFQTPDMLKVFHGRIESKKWRERWPNLEIITK
ncbi:MAG TPA: nucleotidyltransferase family protein [Candidatus Saccharimonadaceae bacterium]|nr:nucleotidyltransferase family protein [Candidatus Saccharimonadaceae bacterium]